MSEYTEQEIEMLARFSADSEDCKWEDMGDGYRLASVNFVHDAIRESTGHSFAPAIRAAARLMREAREQGAAEMREQALAALRALPDGTWGDERGEMSPWPDAIDAVKALKVPQ